MAKCANSQSFSVHYLHQHIMPAPPAPQSFLHIPTPVILNYAATCNAHRILFAAYSFEQV